MLIGATPRRIIQEAEYFIKGKGVCFYEDNRTYIILYGCKESPLLLPAFVCDMYLVADIFIQYKAWSILFDKKIKKKCISLPSHVSKITVSNSTHLMEIYEIHTPFNLKE
jgi:hypothetical protein